MKVNAAPEASILSKTQSEHVARKEPHVHEFPTDTQLSSNLEIEVKFTPHEQKMLMFGAVFGVVMGSLLWIAIYFLKVKPDFEEALTREFGKLSYRDSYDPSSPNR